MFRLYRCYIPTQIHAEQTKRLRTYRASPHDDAYRHIRYHGEEARCPLCAGLLAAWRKK